MKIPARIGYLDDRSSWRSLSQDERYRFALLGGFLDRLSNWLLSIALAIFVYDWTGSVAAVAGVTLAMVVPRLLTPSLLGSLARAASCRLIPILSLLRVPLVAGVLLVDSRLGVTWVLAAAALLGVIGALIDTMHGQALPRLTPRTTISALNILFGRLEQIAMVAASVIATLCVVTWNERAPLAATIVICLAAGMLMTFDGREWQLPDNRARSPQARSARMRGLLPEIRLLAGALFIGATIGMGLRVMLVEIVAGRLAYSEALYALLLGAVGLGALLGPPVPIPRLLGRVPMPVLVLVSVVSLGVAVAFVNLVDSLFLIAIALFMCGLLAVTIDHIATTAARFITPYTEVESALNLLAGAVVAGQGLALVAIVGLTPIWSAETVLMLMSSLGLLAGPALAVQFFVSRRQREFEVR